MRIRQGRVWVTLDANRAHASDDIVLAPGESLRVAAGERLVMEPWDGYGATYTWDARLEGANLSTAATARRGRGQEMS